MMMVQCVYNIKSPEKPHICRLNYNSPTIAVEVIFRRLFPLLILRYSGIEIKSAPRIHFLGAIKESGAI